MLAKIDPATYQAQLDQAVAKKALDEAQLANAERDMERYTKLGGNIVAQKTIDTQRALVDQLTAQIKVDDAAIANAKAFLDYTTILAPIDGRIGIRLVDEGNLVRGSDAAQGIVVITAAQAHQRAVHAAAAAAGAGQQGAQARAHSRSRRSMPTASRRSTAARCRWSTIRSIRPPAPSG